MKKVIAAHDRVNIMFLRFLAATTVLMPGIARAGPVDDMVSAVCGLIAPMAGRSKMISMVFLIALGVMVFLWWMSENKEGVITWILRTGLALGVLINLFTLPGLLGLPSVCSGGF